MSRSSHVLGRYVLYGEIATGGMASVHIARHVGPHGFCRTVAVKRLHEPYARDPEFVAMFLDEARLAARINHPNVVSMIDVVTTPRELCLVMEYVHGQDLARLFKRHGAKHRRGVAAPVAVALIGNVLRGLHAAHVAVDAKGGSLNMVHRDVSPHNILVGFDGTARVLDFGIAKASSRSQVTRDGQIKGKLAYMSPEQLRAENVDARSDVFATGIVLWELLTGERMFAHDNPGATVHAILNRPHTAPSAHVASLPQALDAVTLRALAAEPRDRFASAGEMASALDAACAPATPEQVATWVRDVDGDTLVERDQQLRAVEQVPAKEVVDEVTRADPALAASLADALRAIDDRAGRAELATAADALATQEDAVAVHVADPPAPRSRRWIYAVAVVAGGALAAALRWAPAPQLAEPVLPPVAVALPAAQEEAPLEPPDAASASTIASAAPSSVPSQRALPRTSKASPGPPTPTANCSPNHYYENGIKRFKPECL